MPIEESLDLGKNVVRVTVYAATCSTCGYTGFDVGKVIHADGDYCRRCSEWVGPIARAHADKQLRDMLQSRVVRLPTKNWQPPKRRRE